MNAFEIAEAVSKLAGEPFDPANFPFAFLEAFGNKETTIARLRNGSSNGSDVTGAVLQRSNIHLAVCASGETAKMLESLKASAATKKQKAKFILATDGELLEAEDLASGEAIACDYQKIENHFGFFLPLAGIGPPPLLISMILKPCQRICGQRMSVMTKCWNASILTYTYYEQLNGYEHLKALDIGYYFYSNSYVDDILDVLDPDQKTIIHIPNVNSRESTKDKIKEVEHIISALGKWKGTDPATGFHLVERPDGRILKIADLVDDEPLKREKVIGALKQQSEKNNRDLVDIIIALGMAKEGFDWIWCEHALTVGYRSSLTEIIQIIGRATRDAKGKTRARFTNLIAEPDASEAAVVDAVNDTLKAIAASLLMEQVLAPRFNFTPKNPNSGPVEGFDYGAGGYDNAKPNVGFNEATGQFQIEIKGLVTPESEEATRICREDLNEVITAFVQDKTAIERGMFNKEVVPEELTVARMGKIVKDKYPSLSETDQEAVRQHAIAALNITQSAKKIVETGASVEGNGNTALIDGVRKFALDVRNLDIDLIDHINPFSEAYAILSKAMDAKKLTKIAEIISSKRINLTLEEAYNLAERALKFYTEKGRRPSLTAQDPWEQRMAQGVEFLRKKRAEEKNG